VEERIKYKMLVGQLPDWIVGERAVDKYWFDRPCLQCLSRGIKTQKGKESLFFTSQCI
jgi:hypothetical protein